MFTEPQRAVMQSRLLRCLFQIDPLRMSDNKDTETVVQIIGRFHQEQSDEICVSPWCSTRTQDYALLPTARQGNFGNQLKLSSRS